MKRTQPGRVCLKERRLRVNKPRLRKKGRGADKEVAIPVYQALQQNEATVGTHARDPVEWRFLAALSTRDSGHGRHGGRFAIDRQPETIEASEAALKQLLERRFDEVELLIIYIDGMHFGEQCVLALREGATENAEAAKDLLAVMTSFSIMPVSVCDASLGRNPVEQKQRVIAYPQTGFSG